MLKLKKSKTIKETIDFEKDTIQTMWKKALPYIHYRLSYYFASHQLKRFCLGYFDTVNNFYFYFIKAVEKYNPKKGKFENWLIFYMKTSIIDLKSNSYSIKFDFRRKPCVKKHMPYLENSVSSLAEKIEDSNMTKFENILSDTFSLEYKIVNTDFIDKILDFLESQRERDKKILEKRLFFRESLDMVGNSLGYTKEGIRLIEKRLKKNLIYFLKLRGYDKDLLYNNLI